jgi:transcription-repair coupling factor (superfamily II helicase)
MRDLEIRGAGNLLGTKQSGHIAQIGFGLYCQLLRQSVERLKGGKAKPTASPAFKADFIANTEASFVKAKHSDLASGDLLPAFIPAAWLAETKLRIAAYRELADAVSEASIKKLESSWRDRHGRLPEAVRNLITIARIKAVAARHQISSVELSGQRLILQRNGESIMLAGRRFPRLTSISSSAKLTETIELLGRF